MNIKLLLLIAFASYTYAASIGFAVVAVGGTSVSVKIGGQSYTMTRLYQDVDYFRVSVDVSTPAPFTYKYSMDGVDESFDRTFASGSQTFNEFFGRKDTTKTMWQLGFPFAEKSQWTRNLGPNGVYDDDYISTVFLTGTDAASGQTAVQCFSRDGDNCYGKFTTTIISKYDVGRTESATISTKAGYEPKIQMNLYVNAYRGRWAFKLRPSAYDVSMIRERLYNDVLEAAGCPHQETSHTRVYVGSKPLGLYYLQEITSESDFIQSQFYGKSGFNSNLGSIYDASTGADFYPDGIYNYKLSNSGGSSMANKGDLQALITKVGSLNFASDSALADFSANWLDLDTYLRAVAIEFLTGNWDGYLFYTSNYVMYRETNEGASGTYKFYFIDQDFDQTFGGSISANDDMDGYDTDNMLPYTHFINKQWSNGGASNRVLLDGLMSNANMKAKFEGIIKTLVKSVFNPVALGKRISELHERIKPEVQWDRTLGANRIRQGCIKEKGCTSNDNQFQGYQWSYEEFLDSLDKSVRGDAGLNQWVSARASSIQSQLGVGSYDNPPMSSQPNYGTSSGQVINQPSSTTGTIVSTGAVDVTTAAPQVPAGTTGAPVVESSTTGMVTQVTTGMEQPQPSSTTGGDAQPPTQPPAQPPTEPSSTTGPVSNTGNTGQDVGNDGTTNDQEFSSAAQVIGSIVFSSILITLAF